MGFLIQQPKTLQSFALSKLTEWVTFQAYVVSKLGGAKAEELLSRHIENIRIFLKSKMPKRFHNKLAAQVIQALIKQSNQDFLDDTDTGKRIGRIIEIFFTENLTCLSFEHDIEMFPAAMASASRANLLTGLIDLKMLLIDDLLSDVIIIEESIILQFLKELHELKYLTLKAYSQFYNIDNILTCIAENCKLIEELDLASNAIDNKSIDILTQLQNLRIMNLNGPGVSALGIATLLMSCKKLEVFNVYGIDSAFEHIASFEENAGIRFNLQSYVSNYGTTLEQLQLVIEMCPKIHKISFKRTSQDCLMAFYDLNYLCELELHRFYFNDDQVGDFLQVKGCDLIHLCLQDVEQIDFNALICISQTCPNLESLTMAQCSFKKQSIDDDLMYCKINELDSPPFRNLKKITLHVLDWTPSLTDDQLIFLLSNCLNVEYIDINDQSSPTDDIMLIVLDKNPFIYLKELKIFYCLSMPVISRIIQSSIRPPEVIIYDDQ